MCQKTSGSNLVELGTTTVSDEDIPSRRSALYARRYRDFACDPGECIMDHEGTCQGSCRYAKAMSSSYQEQYEARADAGEDNQDAPGASLWRDKVWVVVLIVFGLVSLGSVAYGAWDIVLILLSTT